MKETSLTTPITREQVLSLNVNDAVYITGVVYTARDMAHLKVGQLLLHKKKPARRF